METFLHDVCVIERERTGCVSLDIAPTCIVVIQVVINTITIYENQEELVEKEHVSYGGANKNN